MNIPNPYTLPVISFVGGSTQELLFHTFYYENNERFDLTYCEANFAIVNYVNKYGVPVLTKKMEIYSDEGTTDQAPNTLRVVLNPSDTVALNGKYVYQISLRDKSGRVEIPNQGIMLITNNIDKSYIQ